MATQSEDLHRLAFNKFVANSVIKTGYGLGIGLLFSLTLLKRRAFPVWFGSGVGLGFALSDYNKQLKSFK